MNMIARCTNRKNPRYKDYGGRGIKICKRWSESFAAFVKDVGHRPSSKHSLDRFPDNDGDYKPGNVRWATSAEQATSRRQRSDTRFLTFDGRKRTVAEWAAIVGLKQNTIKTRLRLGWSVRDALTRPAGPDYYAQSKLDYQT